MGPDWEVGLSLIRRLKIISPVDLVWAVLVLDWEVVLVSEEAEPLD